MGNDPGFAAGVVVHGCGLFLFVPAQAKKHQVRVVVLRDGQPVRVWMGVTGLLFENYIVDASILKIIKCNFR